MGRIVQVAGLMFIFLGLALQGRDLCNSADDKPVLSLQQMPQAELMDVLCEVSGLKKTSAWPKDVSKMTPDEYYKMEVRLLVENGFPLILQDIAPDAMVNRRFFASLMFQIAREVDEGLKKDCGRAEAETEQLECLVRHDYIYEKSLSIYRNEIITVLCSKQDVLKKLLPKAVKPPDIFAEEFREGVLTLPGTPSHRWEQEGQ